jgi:hypothetical protein
MGTRSIHIFPSDNKDKFICQYLQFDGYPENQLAVIIKDIKRVSMSVQCNNNKIEKDVFYNFIRSYYKFRSFETPHSINNSTEVKSYNLKNFTENWWCEWSYEWIEQNEIVFLRVTRLHDLKSIKIRLNAMFELDLNRYENLDDFLEAELKVFENEGDAI